ncbi:hypothetical protein [Streptomyces flavofungini]|uniref:hypothetical protein n=1 Tax=Streptomyces flavofungini TaxID=68200 RepID=UPI0025B0FD27|nr:hypothetical protein [Streptomyces flavofungini]WJV46619.1 hypothetical protein QUY26_14435 [Streptomyces flavofungini]
MLITTIKASVWTADTSGADTDGNIALGICGREFVLDTGTNDFQRGQSQTFTFGAGSNVLNTPGNDPRKPQLDTDELAHYPVYLHFTPRDSKDNWCVEGVTVTVNPGAKEITYGNTPMLGGGDKELWMAADCGRSLYLKRQ